MKQIWIFLLTLTLVLSLAACGNPGGSSDSPASAGNDSASGAQDRTANPDDAQPDHQSGQDSGKPAGAMIPGKLNPIKLDDRDSSILRGVSLSGNRSGSTDFNRKPAAVEGIRCIFELNEYVQITPDTDQKEGLQVWVFQHKDDPAFYETAAFSDEKPGFVQFFELRVEDPESNYWGEFYLNNDELEPGYYDFVFTYQEKAIATLLTRFYKEGELENKSDSELEEIMKGLQG